MDVQFLNCSIQQKMHYETGPIILQSFIQFNDNVEGNPFLMVTLRSERTCLIFIPSIDDDITPKRDACMHATLICFNLKFNYPSIHPCTCMRVLLCFVVVAQILIDGRRRSRRRRFSLKAGLDLPAAKQSKAVRPILII